MKRLKVSTQTIRILTSPDLRAVAGGSDNTSIGSGYTICLTRVRTLCTTVVSARCTEP